MTNGKLWARSFEGAVNVYRGKIMAFAADHWPFYKNQVTNAYKCAYMERLALVTYIILREQFLFGLKNSIDIY